VDSSKANEQNYWTLYNLAITQLGRMLMKKKNQFDKMLIKSIDEAIKEIFGETGARIIYDYLQHNHSLNREEIPERLKDFERGLEKILGSGAWVMERTALNNLYLNFGLEYRNKENYSFANHIGTLKNRKREEAET